MSAFEQWRQIESWPYEVSSSGLVRRSKPGMPSGRMLKHSATYVGKVLKAAQDDDGYWVVILCDRGRLKTAKVHILVCEAFNGPKPSIKHQVRHLDGDNQNNTPSNLRWGTAADNAADRDKHGTTVRGEKSPRAVLSDVQLHELRQLYAACKPAGYQRVKRGSIPKLAKRFGVTESSIYHLVKGQRL